MRVRHVCEVLIVGAVLTVPACGADTTSPPGSSGDPPGDPTFAAAVQPILTRSCAFSGCHAGATPQEGMDLSVGRAYGSLVGVASTQVPRLFRIAAGNPDSSYVVLKLEGAAGSVGGVGTRMPLGGELTSAELATIRAWVSAGAADN